MDPFGAGYPSGSVKQQLGTDDKQDTKMLLSSKSYYRTIASVGVYFSLIGFCSDSHAVIPGTLDQGYAPRLDGEVRTLVVLPDNKALVGGSFKTVNGAPRSGIARLNEDGSLDSFFNPGTGIGGPTNASIAAILRLENGKIMVGGTFTTLNGMIRTNVARLNPDGSVDSTFLANAVSEGREIKCFALQSDGCLLMGGYRVYRVNENGERDPTMKTSLTGWGHTWPSSAIDPSVATLMVQSDARIVIEGFFRGSPMRIYQDGSMDSSFNSGGPTITIDSFAPDMPATTTLAGQSDGKFLLGGVFGSIQGQFQPRLARINHNGTLDSSFHPLMDFKPFEYRGISFILVQKNGKILVGGPINTVNYEPRTNLVQLTADGSLDREFYPFAGTEQSISTAAEQHDGKLLLGGSFTRMNGTDRAYLARLNGYDTTPRAPVIVQQPANMVAEEGSNAKIFVIQDGPDPQYQWFLNNSPLVYATNYFVIITNISPATAGDYSVMVSNKIGSVVSLPARFSIIDSIGRALNNTDLFWHAYQGFDFFGSWSEISSGTGWLIETNDTHDTQQAICSSPAAFYQVNPMTWLSSSSRLQTTVTGPGLISFWWKVNYTSDRAWGNITFLIDDIEKSQLRLLGSNEPTEWQKVTLDVPPGTNVLEWQTTSSSMYPGFVALLDGVSYTAAPRFHVIANTLNQGRFQFTLEGANERVFHIERSEDLIEWHPFTTVTNQTGIIKIEDTDANFHSRSFYRAIIK